MSSEASHLVQPALIGGSNSVYRLDAVTMRALTKQLIATARVLSASLLVTPSRRTGDDNFQILKREFAGVPHLLWGGQGTNPYFGMLSVAGFIVVTADPVNMVSEAASTGKPVYITDLPGGSEKFTRFHSLLRDEGVTRPFTSLLESYCCNPLEDMTMVATKVKARLRKIGAHLAFD